MADDKRDNDILAALTGRVMSTLKSAVEYRTSLGISQDWLDDQQYYDGRSVFGGIGSQIVDKALAAVGEDYRGLNAPKGVGALFLEVTRSYTDSGESRASDLLLPSHDKGWALEPLPIPGLDDASKGTVSPELEAQVRAQVEADGLPAGSDGHEEAVQEGMAGVRETASGMMEQARAAARQAELLISDWHEQGEFRVQLLKVVETAARLGTGILMGPRREMHRRLVFKSAGAEPGQVDESGQVMSTGGELMVEEGFIPVSRAVLPWNCYPDPECGEDIQDGSFHWERDWIQRRELQELRDRPEYNGSAVQRALKEGPLRSLEARGQDAEEGGGPPSAGVEEWGRFEYWYGYMDVGVEELRAVVGESGDSGSGYDAPEHDGSVISVSVEVVNDRIIRMEPTLMAAGGDRFPYSYFRWARTYDRDGSPIPWGRGIPSLIRVPQRAINGAYNRAIQNAGIASFPMFEYDSSRVQPKDGVAEIVAGKVWEVQSTPGGTAGGGQNQMAIRPIEVPMYLDQLTAWMQVNMQLCEDLSGLTGVTGSSAGRSAPDTVGGMQLASNQADSAIRRIVRMFDDDLMEPHIRRYYEYLLLDPDVEDEVKGDFVVHAKGTSVLERSMDLDVLNTLAQLSANPSFQMDPAKVAAEIARKSGMDPERYQFTPEQLQAMEEAERAAAERPPHQVEVAQIRAQADLQKEETKAMSADRKNQLELEVEALREKRNIQDLSVREFEAILKALAEDEKLDRADRRHAEEMKVKIAGFVAAAKKRNAVGGSA